MSEALHFELRYNGRVTPQFFFYLARCSDGTLYAGASQDVAARERRHNEGRGAKDTKNRRPVKIVYVESFDSLRAARRREAEVKTWSKARKESLVRMETLPDISPE